MAAFWDGGGFWDAVLTWDYVAPAPAPAPSIAPTFSQQLWSETVGLALAEGGLPPIVAAYQFSNGAKFGDAEKAYSPLDRIN